MKIGYKVLERILNEAYPLDLGQKWDNCGWQINLKNELIERVLVCTTVTRDTLKQAIEQNCQLILSHHPMIFLPLKKIENDLIIKSIQNNISIFCCHTNFDTIATSKTLKNLLMKDFIKENMESQNEFIEKCVVSDDFDFEKFIKICKDRLKIEIIKTYNYESSRKIERVAFCSGSGSDFIEILEKNDKIDLFITSDIKYHDAILAENMILFDVGHLESERPSLFLFEKLLKENGLKVIIADEKNTFEYI